MSVPNFNKVIAKNYYVIEGYNYQYYDEETQDYVDTDEFDPESIDDELNCVAYKAEAEGWYRCKDERMESGRYDGYKLATKEFSQDFLNSRMNINAEVELTYQNGRYTGANLDYDIRVDLDHGTSYYLSDYSSVYEMAVDMADDWLSEIEYYDYENIGMGLARMQYKNLIRKIESLTETAIESAEAFCKDSSTTYYCTGIFSNGEATYCKL